MPIVNPIHARVGEIVEIHWHRNDRPEPGVDPATRIDVLRERHTAPPVATWDARSKRPAITEEPTT
jgi:hypothetical protein